MTTTTDVHAWCVDALPAWLDGALATEAADALTNHLRGCADCRGELELARRVRAHFDREWRAVTPLLDADHEHRQFDALWSRIADGPEARAPAPRPQRMSAWAALAATLLVASAVGWYHGAVTPDFRTLADGPPQRCTALRVQVNGAPTDAVRSALESTGATIVDSRSSGAAFVLTASDPAAALIALRALPEVRLAQPIDC